MTDLCLMACYNCRFWDASDEERLDGMCRYFPPSMAGTIAPHGNATFQQPEAAVWPVTRRDEWCGRFDARKTLEEVTA